MTGLYLTYFTPFNGTRQNTFIAIQYNHYLICIPFLLLEDDQ